MYGPPVGAAPVREAVEFRVKVEAAAMLRPEVLANLPCVKLSAVTTVNGLLRVITVPEFSPFNVKELIVFAPGEKAKVPNVPPAPDKFKSEEELANNKPPVKELLNRPCKVRTWPKKVNEAPVARLRSRVSVKSKLVKAFPATTLRYFRFMTRGKVKLPPDLFKVISEKDAPDAKGEAWVNGPTPLMAILEFAPED